jgi:hypothetical protein
MRTERRTLEVGRQGNNDLLQIGYIALRAVERSMELFGYLRAIKTA